MLGLNSATLFFAFSCDLSSVYEHLSVVLGVAAGYYITYLYLISLLLLMLPV